MMLRLCLALLCGSLLSAAEFRAGVARVDITPPLPAWLSGYAARNVPADSVAQRIWAKALALDDGHGGRFVLITTDLIGLPQELTAAVSNRLQQRLRLRRSQVAFNSSHTHSGPVVPPTLPVMYALSPADQARTEEYGRILGQKLEQVASDAVGALKPAHISFGQGEATFAINRRVARLKELHPGEEIPAPVDHSVPVWRVTSPDGQLRAILFGYACHNTTLTGEFHAVSGDYAGHAQAALEQAHPGAMALFLMLCGADQNPSPRSRVELAEQHGRALAASVERTLTGSLRPLPERLRAAYQEIPLAFAPHTRTQYEKDLTSKDVYQTRRAKLMLSQYDAGRPVRALPYPVQVVQWGDSLSLVFLGGEVVIDYALRIKREFGPDRVVVAGYSNAVMAYIPSLRVLREGGYEGGDSMVYYGQPGPFAPDVEERIFRVVKVLFQRR